MEHTPPKSHAPHFGSTSELVEFWETTTSHSIEFYSASPRKFKRQKCVGSPYELYDFQSNLRRGSSTINNGFKNDGHTTSTGFNSIDIEQTMDICLSPVVVRTPRSEVTPRKSFKRTRSPATSDDRTPLRVTITSPLEGSRSTQMRRETKLAVKALKNNSNKNTMKINKSCTSRPTTRYTYESTKNAMSSPYRSPRPPIKKRLQIVGNDLKYVYVSPFTGMKRLEKSTSVTKPLPFRFQLRDMAKENSEKAEKKEEQINIQFKAREPKVLKKEPFFPEVPGRRIEGVNAPNLRTEGRAQNWYNLKKIRLRKAKEIRQMEEELMKAEKESIRKIRKTLEFKASPWQKPSTSC